MAYPAQAARSHLTTLAQQLQQVEQIRDRFLPTGSAKLESLRTDETLTEGDSIYAYTFTIDKTQTLIDIGKEVGMVAKNFTYNPGKERIIGISDENEDEYHIHLCVQNKQTGNCEHFGDINFVDIPEKPSAAKLVGGRTDATWEELNAAAVEGAQMLG